MYPDIQLLRHKFTTPTARLRGVLGIHGNYLTTGSFRLVVEQLPELTPSSVVCRQRKVVMLRHKAECQILRGYQSVVRDHLPRQLVPEVPALVRNPFVDASNLSVGFTPPPAPLLSSGYSTLGNSKLLELMPKPARVSDSDSITERKKVRQTHIHPNSRTEMKRRLLIWNVQRQADVPFPEALLQDDVLDLCVFRNRPVILDFDLTHILDVEHHSSFAVFSQFAPASVSVFQRSEAIASLVSWETGFLPGLETTEKGREGFIKTPEKLLYACGIQLTQRLRIGMTFIPKMLPLIRVTDAFAGFFIGVYPLTQRRIVELASLLKEKGKDLLLSTAGIESVFVGSFNHNGL